MTEVLTEEEIKQLMPWARVVYKPDLRMNITDRDVELTRRFLKKLDYSASRLHDYPEFESRCKSAEDITYFVKCLEIRKKIIRQKKEPRDLPPDISWRESFRLYLAQFDERKLSDKQLRELFHGRSPKGRAGKLARATRVGKDSR